MLAERDLIVLQLPRKGTPTLYRVRETGFDRCSEAEGCRTNWKSDAAVLATARWPHIGLYGRLSWFTVKVDVGAY